MPAVASHIFHSGDLTALTDTVVSTNSIIVYGILFSSGRSGNKNIQCRDNDGNTVLEVNVRKRQSTQLHSTWLAPNGLTIYVSEAGSSSNLAVTVIYSVEG